MQGVAGSRERITSGSWGDQHTGVRGVRWGCGGGAREPMAEVLACPALPRTHMLHVFL